MSFQNSDDFEILSTHSHTSQQSQNASVTRNHHLSLAQMRGVIQIFNHYFPKNAKKRLKKHEKKERWVSYKKRIYREYGRIVSGQLASEKALVKRYSDPLTFIKYKLKRNTNLKIEDLTPLDQDYYMEIGGLRDINELIKRTYNIDSIDKIQRINCKRQTVKNVPSFNNNNNYNNNNNINNNIDNDDDNNDDDFTDSFDAINQNANKRRRLNKYNTDNSNNSNMNRNNYNSIGYRNNNNYNNNNNKNNNNNSNRNKNIRSNNFNVGRSNTLDLTSSMPPEVSQAPTLFTVKTEQNNNKTIYSRNVDAALRKVNNEMDVYEQELLDKKKLETFEITKQKIMSLKRFLENILSNEPEFIGFIPGVGTHIEQIENAFYYWLNENKIIIQSETDKQIFIQQILTLKNDMMEWNEFLSKWKLLRIFHNNNFNLIWNEIKVIMNITQMLDENNVINNENINDNDNNDARNDKNSNDNNNNNIDNIGNINKDKNVRRNKSNSKNKNSKKEAVETDEDDDIDDTL